MKKLIVLLTLVCTFFVQQNTSAQDLHYSQHIYNPLYYNPAFTGFIKSRARVTASYADRYRQAYGSNGMRTVFASGDMNFPVQNGYSNNSAIGAGAYFYNHMAGENSIMDNVAALLVSYRISLDKEKKHTIAAGFNASYWNRRYDYTNLQFGNQYDGIYYNPAINSGEGSGSASKNRLDAGLGVLYAFAPMDKFKGYIGTSVYHLIPDNDNVISLGQGLRYNVHAGLELDFKDISLQPTFMFDNQGKAMEMYTGVLFKYFIINEKKEKFSLFAGPYMRMYRSPIGEFSLYTINVFGGIQYNDFQLFVAADNTINQSKNTFGGFNGFEVGLSYNFGEVDQGGKRLYCPTFR